MYSLSDLFNDIIFDAHLRIQFSELEQLMRLYIIPSFNRDYPHVRAVSIDDEVTKFYPHRDLTGYDSSSFLNHIFLIRQNRDIVWVMNQDLEYKQSEFDYFTTITSTELLKKIIGYSYKSNSFVYSPIILYDETEQDYYYSLENNSKYVLIYTVLNNIIYDTTAPGDTKINISEYDALKYYSIQKITDYIINGMDMSTIGVLDSFVSKLLEGMSSADVSTIFNPAISSLSLGGEMSISFTGSSNIISTTQQALPSITSGYSVIGKSLKVLSSKAHKRFNNQLRKKLIWLFMV